VDRDAIAAEYGLTEHAHRLTGETEAEFRSDAMEFCRTFGVGNLPDAAIDLSQGRGLTEPVTSPLADAVAEILHLR
jgi:hypothetical protein